MIAWHAYKNPTDRIAAALIETVRNTRPVARAHPRGQTAVLQQLVVRLAGQASRQGLTPIDFDVPNGSAALEAIAVVVFSTRRSSADALAIDGLLGPAETALRAALPVEWRRVVDAATRIADAAAATQKKKPL